MKIMLQNHTFYPALGGIENYLYHVSMMLKEMGHQPIILCEKHDLRLSDFESYQGIEIIRHPYYFIQKPMLFMKPRIVSYKIRDFLSNYVKDLDLIISRYPHYCYATCSLDVDAPIFYIPATVYWKYVRRSAEDSALREKFFGYLWKPILNHMESTSITMSDEVITLSRSISTSLAEYYNVDGNRFTVNNPGVDIKRFDNSHKRVEAREELSIPRDRVVVLYVGRLSLEKNVERLIKEVSGIRRKDLHLLIVGDGPDRSRLEELAKELRMTERVTFAGLRRDVEECYGASDIFVLASRYEAFGQVILEAMAAGLPCIAFKKVPPEYEVASEEIIEEGVTGYCVNPYDGDEFKEKLLYLIGNPNIRKEMGEASRKLCQKKYTWEGHVKRLLDLLSN